MQDEATGPRHVDDELVTVFASRSHLATVEAEVIHALLESAGIRSWLVRENVVQQPVGMVLIKVPASLGADAQQVIADARDDGNEPSTFQEPELT